MGRLKSDLQNALYGNKIKSQLQMGENMIFQDSVAYYTEAKASTGYRAVVGITDRRIIIEPTIQSNNVTNFFYYDIQSIEEEIHQGFRLGRQPVVIHIVRKDGFHFYIYAFSCVDHETRNMLLTIQNALRNFNNK